MLWQTFLIKKNERGLLLRNNDFERVLTPGKHRIYSLKGEYRVEACSLEKAYCDHALANYLRLHEPAVVAEHFHRCELSDEEVGLRYENGNLAEILPPGYSALYWKDASDYSLQRINLREQERVEDHLLARLTQMSLRGRSIAGTQGVLNVQVPTAHVGVLRSEGKNLQLLTPGRYGYWRFNRDIAIELVDTRVQALEVSGQEILTRDKVSLRINLSANWQLSDVAKAFANVAKPADYLYRELQFALRAAVGTRSLDELLENKQLIDQQVAQQVRERVAEMGITLCSLGVKDIVLPGEMKALLAQVVEAEKAAQANVIRRREETGATRSLLNTAKVMEDNPTALRLKELETLEKLAERIDRISVFGGLDQLLSGLVSIK